MTTEKFRTLFDPGFKSVSVNRPDQKRSNLVSNNPLRNIAEQAHVGVIYQPITNTKVSETDVVDFSK